MKEERGLRFDPADDLTPLTGRRVEKLGIDASPSHEDLHQEMATVVARQDVGPALRRRQVAEHQRVLTRRRAESMEEDVAVVLIFRWVAGGPETGDVGPPGDRRGAGVLARISKIAN